MEDSRYLSYSSIPEYEAWTIPLWDYRDRDEYADLLNSLRMRGPERFGDAVHSFQEAVGTSNTEGILFAIGSDLPAEMTLVLRPDSCEQAAEILAETAGFMATRAVVTWDQIATHLWGVHEVLKTEEASKVPAFGLGAIIPSAAEGQYVTAPTSWIGRQLEEE